MIGKAIFNRLTTDSAVGALVVTRVFPELTPEQRDFPVVVYAVHSGADDADYGHKVNPVKRMVTIISIATTYGAMSDLAEAVKASLDNQAGTWGGVVVQGVFFEDELDDVMTVGTEFKMRYYLKEQTYTTWFNEN